MQIVRLMTKFSLVAVGAGTLVGIVATSSLAGSFTGTYSFEGSPAATTSGSPIGFSDFSSVGVKGGVNNITGVENNRYVGSLFTENNAPDLGNEYFEFSVNPLGNSPTTFNNFSFNSHRRFDTVFGVVNGPTLWQLQASIGGGNFFEVKSGQLAGTAQDVSESVSSLNNVTQQVIFRLYGYGAPSPLNVWTIDDVVLSGITAVPTPAVLPAIVGFGLSMWRKRKPQTD
jgi:hypothetical protein